MNDDHGINFASLKVSVAWVGVAIGGITLSQIALVLTIAYTALQLYLLIRKLRRERRLERLEAQLRQPEVK